MNTKMRIRIFTDRRPGQEETDHHAHLSNTRQLPSTGRSVIPRYSAATKKRPQFARKITIFPVFMNKTQILLFALATGSCARTTCENSQPCQEPVGAASQQRRSTGPNFVPLPSPPFENRNPRPRHSAEWPADLFRRWRGLATEPLARSRGLINSP